MPSVQEDQVLAGAHLVVATAPTGVNKVVVVVAASMARSAITAVVSGTLLAIAHQDQVSSKVIKVVREKAKRGWIKGSPSALPNTTPFPKLGSSGASPHSPRRRID